MSFVNEKAPHESGAGGRFNIAFSGLGLVVTRRLFRCRVGGLGLPSRRARLRPCGQDCGDTQNPPNTQQGALDHLLLLFYWFWSDEDGVIMRVGHALFFLSALL